MNLADNIFAILFNTLNEKIELLVSSFIALPFLLTHELSGYL